MPRLVVCCLAVVLQLLVAPDVSGQGSAFGVKGGMVSSDLKLGDNEAGAEAFWDRKTGVTGGAFLALGGTVGIQLEAIYSQKGIAGDTVFEGQSVSGEFRLAYLELPLLLKLRLGSGPIRPYLFGGPALSIELLCEAEVTLGGNTTAADCDSEEGEGQTGGAERRTTELGAVAGAGLEIGSGAMAFLVELRYARGLQSLDKSDDVDLKNEAISVLAGISLPLGRRAR